MPPMGGHPQQRWYDPLRYGRNKLRGLIIKVDKEAAAAAAAAKDDKSDDDDNKLLMFTGI
jgi:hypothetical protein